MVLPHNRSWFHLGKIKITRHKFKLWPPSILVSTYPSKTKDQLSISHQRSQWARSDDEQHCYSSAGLKTYWIKQAGFIQESDSLLLPYPQEHPACLQLTPCVSSGPEQRSPVLLSALGGGAQRVMVGLPVSESWWQRAGQAGAAILSLPAR